MAKEQSSLLEETPLCSLGCASATSGYSELSIAFCELSLSFLVNSGRGISTWQTPGDEKDLLQQQEHRVPKGFKGSYRWPTPSKDGM